MLDLARVKGFLRIDADFLDEDDTLDALLAAAIGMVEAATGHLLTVQDVVEPVSIRRMGEPGGIRLFKAPVNEVTGVSYLDGGVDPDLYTVEVAEWQLVEGSEARLLPGWGAAWPSLDRGQALTVTYSAGYAEGAIPPALEQAVVSLVAHLYQHRDDAPAIPPAIDAMLSPYRPIGIA